MDTSVKLKNNELFSQYILTDMIINGGGFEGFVVSIFS